jgi:hypothetical protein
MRMKNNEPLKRKKNKKRELMKLSFFNVSLDFYIFFNMDNLLVFYLKVSEIKRNSIIS